MLTIISDLQASVSTLRTQVSNAVNLAGTLKGQRDAAVTENGVQAQTIAALQAQLAAAQGAGLSAEDAAAITDATASVQAAAQELSDSNTVNAPSN